MGSLFVESKKQTKRANKQTKTQICTENKLVFT